MLALVRDTHIGRIPEISDDTDGDNAARDSYSDEAITVTSGDDEFGSPSATRSITSRKRRYSDTSDADSEDSICNGEMDWLMSELASLLCTYLPTILQHGFGIKLPLESEEDAKQKRIAAERALAFQVEDGLDDNQLVALLDAIQTNVNYADAYCAVMESNSVRKAWVRTTLEHFA
jgi:hypothetical protein